MTRSDLIQHVVSNTSFTESEARVAIDATLKAIFHGVTTGHRVTVREFGAFEAVMRGSKSVRNILTKKQFTIPPQKVIKFKPAKLMKADLAFHEKKKQVV